MDGERQDRRGYARFSAKIAREICARVAAGETQEAICADPDMPCAGTLWRWTRKHPQFGRIYAQARALSGREGNAKDNSYCPARAHELLARVAEGETLTAIAADPRMPSMTTIFRWRRYEPEFAERLELARAALAERFSDLGWKLAMEATPETAFVTQVRLKQLRWMTRVFSPRTHGALKPVEPPTVREVMDISTRTWRVEVNPQTGMVRSVSMHFSPDQGLVRQVLGDWEAPEFPLQLGRDPGS